MFAARRRYLITYTIQYPPKGSTYPPRAALYVLARVPLLSAVAKFNCRHGCRRLVARETCLLCRTALTSRPSVNPHSAARRSPHRQQRGARHAPLYPPRAHRSNSTTGHPRAQRSTRDARITRHETACRSCMPIRSRAATDRQKRASSLHSVHPLVGRTDLRLSASVVGLRDIPSNLVGMPSSTDAS